MLPTTTPRPRSRPAAARGLALAPLVLVAGLSAAVQAADEPPGQDPKALRLSVEVKTNFRHSVLEERRLALEFPADFIAPGADGVYLRTPSAGSSLELSNVAFLAEASLTPHITARARLHFLDLYSRNPTSADDRFLLREAWVRFGSKYEALTPIPGSSLYLLIGKAPRFTRQVNRRLESYGLWGTAVGRFEEVQVEAGGSFGKHVYLRAQVGNPNPLFFRDPNALAGDNGTPERVPGNVRPVYQSGFPILYDAKATDVNLFGGNLQWGGGVGVRFASDDGHRALDALGWHFERDLADKVAIRGSYYWGDLLLLRHFEAAGIVFPLSGVRKSEDGLNLEGALGNLHVFGQYVKQDIAGLKRDGFEIEGAFRLSLGGSLVSGDTPLFTWLEPVVRVSQIKNHFFTPRLYPAPSVGWDWTKIDFAMRLSVTPTILLTAEYARHDVTLFNGGKIHPDETLVTLRVGF